jgi:hypothetical protein
VVGHVSEYCIMREKTVRKRIGCYNKYVVGYIPSFIG